MLEKLRQQREATYLYVGNVGCILVPGELISTYYTLLPEFLSKGSLIYLSHILVLDTQIVEVPPNNNCYNLLLDRHATSRQSNGEQ